MIKAGGVDADESLTRRWGTRADEARVKRAAEWNHGPARSRHRLGKADCPGPDP